MTEIEALGAVEHIKRLKAKYFYYLDRKDWEGWRDQVFCADARLEIEGLLREPLIGIDDIITFACNITAGAKTVHHGHMPDIDLISPKHARGIWAMEDNIYWSDEQPYEGKFTFMHGFGHYHETYERGADGWRITSLRLDRLFLELR